MTCRLCGRSKPSNLELWETSQPRGQRVTDKQDWAAWFLVQYPEDMIRLLKDYGYQVTAP